MNMIAYINGKRYEYVNEIKNINGSDTVVLCRDEHGCFCYCDADTWRSSVQAVLESSQAEQRSEGNGTSAERVATFNKYASPKDKIALFRSLFVGRDVYSKRYYSKNTGKSGYVPACGNEWVQGVCDKKQYKCAECPNRSFLPLTDDVLYRHLSGKDEFGCDVVGTYSMLPDETTKFLAIDFDEDSWKEDVTSVRTVCGQYSIPAYVERSRSGNGAHISSLCSAVRYVIVSTQKNKRSNAA